jgi:hypothetical protein
MKIMRIIMYWASPVSGMMKLKSFKKAQKSSLKAGNFCKKAKKSSIKAGKSRKKARFCRRKP